MQADTSQGTPPKKPRADEPAAAAASAAASSSRRPPPPAARPTTAPSVTPLTQCAAARHRICYFSCARRLATPPTTLTIYDLVTRREEKDRLNAKYGKIRPPTPDDVANMGKECKLS